MAERRIEVIAVVGIGEVAAGADLAGELVRAMAGQGIAPRSQDILVVTSKVVSKAEGRFARLDAVEPGAEAQDLARITGKDPRLVELVLAESTAVVRAAPHVLITRHRTGHVMANAGIDQSNTGPDADGRVLLLPLDPDASAAALRQDLQRHLGAAPAVVVSDSFGRPWRNGLVNVALGASGLPAIFDRRGGLDRDGRRLEVTQIAVADLVASAAGLACGEGDEGIPAALVRGYAFGPPHAPAAALIRPLEQDLFR